MYSHCDALHAVYWCILMRSVGELLKDISLLIGKQCCDLVDLQNVTASRILKNMKLMSLLKNMLYYVFVFVPWKIMKSNRSGVVVNHCL